MTITENEFCSYYDVVQALIKKHSQFDFNNFMQEMASTVVSNTPLKNFDDCAINYGQGSMENRMYSLAIISMSWLFNNMKRKVEDGHCHNTKHDHGDRNPRLCVKGSEFHKKLYDESLKSFEGVLQLAKEHVPKIITSPQKK
jgi:hypothetical protein